MRFEIIRTADNFLDSAYAEKFHCMNVLDEIDRPPGNYFALDTITGEKIISFQAKTELLKGEWGIK